MTEDINALNGANNALIISFNAFFNLVLASSFCVSSSALKKSIIPPTKSTIPPINPVIPSIVPAIVVNTTPKALIAFLKVKSTTFITISNTGFRFSNACFKPSTAGANASAISLEYLNNKNKAPAIIAKGPVPANSKPNLPNSPPNLNTLPILAANNPNGAKNFLRLVNNEPIPKNSNILKFPPISFPPSASSKGFLSIPVPIVFDSLLSSALCSFSRLSFFLSNSNIFTNVSVCCFIALNVFSDNNCILASISVCSPCPIRLPPPTAPAPPIIDRPTTPCCALIIFTASRFCAISMAIIFYLTLLYFLCTNQTTLLQHQQRLILNHFVP